jgi:hypothetical protein
MIALLVKEKEGASLMAHGIVRNVMEQCARKLEPSMDHLSLQ